MKNYSWGKFFRSFNPVVVSAQPTHNGRRIVMKKLVKRKRVLAANSLSAGGNANANSFNNFPYSGTKTRFSIPIYNLATTQKPGLRRIRIRIPSNCSCLGACVYV